MTVMSGREDLSTYAKILGAYPVSASAVSVREPAYTQDSPMESTEMQIVTLIRSAPRSISRCAFASSNESNQATYGGCLRCPRG